MKPSHFLYKSDGLYYMQNVPNKEDFYFIKVRAYMSDESTEFDEKSYNEALERAKENAVKVDDATLESSIDIVNGEIINVNLPVI